MFASLKNHPFAVEAFFERSLVLTFAVPKEELQGLIPGCLGLDTFKDQWAFIAVAMVQATGLRPKGFPAFMGSDFLLVGYRIFVRYTTVEGKHLRGLYILGSETDKRKMAVLGNIFTNYKYTKTDLELTNSNDITEVRAAAGFYVQVSNERDNVQLPPGSPFADWKEARRFAGPLPFTFSYDAVKKMVLIVEGVRENWVPAPVRVVSHCTPFIDKLCLKGVVLANAFVIENIPYYWKKGRTEPWTAQ